MDMDRMKFAQGAARLFLAHIPDAPPDIRAHAEAISNAQTESAMIDVANSIKGIAAATTEAYALFEACCLASAPESVIRFQPPEVWAAQIIDYLSSVGVPRAELEALVRV